MPEEKKVYRLKVCGTIEFDPNIAKDRELGALLLGQAYMDTPSEDVIERAIQSLREECTELSIEMTRI